MTTTTYGDAIRLGFDYLLSRHPEVFVMGQGLWSPWYVGNSMTDLEKKFGTDRVIDTPVSESACTGAAIGASLYGYRPIVVHPRMDFMLYCMDAIVNQAAKWSSTFGGQAHPAVTIRGVINRGGEQGSQHSQALHAWFAHIPGLRVVMPATVADARDMLIAAVLCDDPVLYIDDRWLYGRTAEIAPIATPPLPLHLMGPALLESGTDLTLVGASYTTTQCLEVADALRQQGVSCDVIDLRVINPLDCGLVARSVEKTGRLLVVDGGWSTCGLAGEVIAQAAERVPLGAWKSSPRRVTLPDAPAPSAGNLEDAYYPQASGIEAIARACLAAC
ncbi:alpha-ketoacid dehydrogenase subunit beta [Caenimonas sedimenti]|uniref:Alpha-ketoacid dehydrogenase subunit beta n=1 Tax=Caenimonas sedimenti TaxID=2596921 RepID=A0A562ZF27_9BURK|nr:transketolase C-terminal domain-containing protein [Caenimonas sedimenti]TWO66152.1 alpha-ketoacid dehydrogenase subunit beta [Caenimonas sedimenti]